MWLHSLIIFQVYPLLPQHKRKTWGNNIKKKTQLLHHSQKPNTELDSNKVQVLLYKNYFSVAFIVFFTCYKYVKYKLSSSGVYTPVFT